MSNPTLSSDGQSVTAAEQVNPGLVHGWICFHCWECFPPTFAGQQAARHHFGDGPTEDPACRINARQFRAMQDLTRSYQNEDTTLHREIYRLKAEHATALLREEEKGYARGLEDAKKYPETLGLQKRSVSEAAEQLPVKVNPNTLSVTHVCDGQEVVTGAEDGQAWVATFADRHMAAHFVNWSRDKLFHVNGLCNQPDEPQLRNPVHE